MLSRSIEDYLTAVYRLMELHGVAKTSEIAKVLRVKPSTVTKVLRKLSSEGYVVWEPYKGFKLSDKGLAIAQRVIWKHRVAERFLHDVLKFDISECHRLAHLLEHMPDEFFDRLYEYLGKPITCPHGNPIPLLGSRDVPKVDDVSLASLPEGSTCIVSRILCFVNEKAVSVASSMGINLGKELLVVEKGIEGIVIEVNNRRILLEYPVARIVRCRR